MASEDVCESQSHGGIWVQEGPKYTGAPLLFERDDTDVWFIIHFD